jgi:hypothetical protein
MKKKIKLQLVGLDGNAFALMGAFQRQARKEGWTKEEIDKVMEECMKGDYDHLLATLMDHCEDAFHQDEDDDDEHYDDEEELVEDED